MKQIPLIIPPTKLSNRAISFFMFFLFFMIGTFPLYASNTDDFKWVINKNDTKTFSATLQVKPYSDYLVGSSTIVIKFDKDALSYASYDALSFKTGDYEHDLYPGKGGASIVIYYNGTTKNGSTLASKDWTSLGEITFTVIDKSKYSGLSIVKGNSILHESDNNTCVKIGDLNDDNTALPVTWLFVKAMNSIDSINQILWATAAEINNDRFEVERSFLLDTASFSAVALVKGKGNSMQITYYNTYDTLPHNLQGETVYYRIKQIDYNGSVSYSKIVKVVGEMKGTNDIKVSLSSNPLTVHLEEIPENSTKLAVLDMNGRELLATDLREKETIINTDNYAKGMYFIIVYTKHSQEKFKIMK